MALLEGALEVSRSIQVPAQRQPYLDGSRLGGGARLAGRSCGLAAQRSAALGFEPIGARGAQPAGYYVSAEGDAPMPAADEQRLAIVPARSNAAELSARKASGSKVPAYLGGVSGAGLWVGSPPEGSPTSLQIFSLMTS